MIGLVINLIISLPKLIETFSNIYKLVKSHNESVALDNLNKAKTELEVEKNVKAFTDIV